MKRRSLLIGAGTLALGQLLAGCRNAGETLRVLFLEDSVPSQILGDFQSGLKQNIKLSFAPRPQLADLFKLLQTWHQGKSQKSSGIPITLPIVNPKPPRVADLVTLGDYWLTAAIQQELIQPLSLTELEGWKRLPATWQTLVRRNDRGELDAQGKVWAAPYRWGTLAIAYRKDEFQAKGWEPPQDWTDLWRPELKGLLSLPDGFREVIGLVLKKLNQSVNTTDLNAVPDLESNLASLQRQVKFYSSNAYLQPLMLTDTLMAVGWSTDIVPLAERDPRVGAIVPQSGTILFSDLWVRPAKAMTPPNSSATAQPATGQTETAIANQWIDFCWKPEVATRLTLLGSATSPIVLQDRAQLPDRLKNDPLLLPSEQILERSEFLQPLPAAVTQQYQQLWTKIRESS